MVLLIDNYDSFTYNLVQMCGSIRPDIQVIRNDQMTLSQIRGLRPDHIILSPGPGYPRDAGVCEEVVRQMKEEAPILGVCLGHQGICEAFGARIAHARRLMHGKSSQITIDPRSPLFTGLKPTIQAARYHSLIAERETFPGCLAITAQDEMGEIMAVEHRSYPIYGLQFHPESILTPEGSVILENFLTRC